MKRASILCTILMLLFAACNLGAATPTATQPVQEMVEPTPIPPTNTPEPTATLEPSPTPIPPTEKAHIAAAYRYSNPTHTDGGSGSCDAIG